MEGSSYRDAKKPDILSRDKKIVREKETFELWSFELQRFFYKSLLGNFHGASEFVRKKETFEL